MPINQDRSLRKPSGGRNTSTRPKKKHNTGSEPTLPTIGEKRVKVDRSRGGKKKERLLSTDEANVFNPETEEHEVMEIKNVVENEANPNYVGRNILTKGAIIVTDEGKARITNKPGREKHVNATLINE